MFERILVPVDLSQRSQPVIAMAGQLSKLSEGVIHLVHIVETLDPSLEAEMASFYERVERVAQDHLSILGEALTEQEVSWQAEVILGHRETDILRRAEELDVDLIALQSHAVERDNPAHSWTTLSYQLGIFSTRPVLLMK